MANIVLTAKDGPKLTLVTQAGPTLVLKDATKAPTLVLNGGLSGAAGAGVPRGGTANQVLAKTNGTDYSTQWVDQNGGSGAVTTVSITTANGVSGTVATPTTTPAISLSLGAITPSSVAATGTVTGSNLSGTNTGDQTTITGNAGTATKLLVARTIAGVSFDGSANISLASTNLSDTASIATLTGTQTLSNKRVTPRITTATSTATPAINTDNVDVYGLTALAVDITGFTMTGTPTDGQILWVYIVGTATRNITWGTSFESGASTLPAATPGTTRLDATFVWNAATSKWRCMGSSTAASGGTGTVMGPVSSTDKAITRWNSTAGTVIQNSTATLSDTGDIAATTLAVGVTGASAATPITATVDTTTATQPAILAKNNTNFAHAGPLVKVTMLNATDSGNVLRIENAGTGKSISGTNATTETFSVDKAGKVVASALQVTGGTIASGKVLTSDGSGNATWQTVASSGSGITRSVATISANTSAGATALTDYVYICTGSTGYTLTLPTAVGNTNRYTVKNGSTANQTLATTSAQTVDGSASATLTPNTSLDLISDGTNWRTI